MNENLLPELRKPFHSAHVTWKPGSVTKDQTKALALAYADLRAYQNRLDEVAGMDWSVTYTPWGERIVCHLTINGVTRSSSGEPDSQSERNEVGGTSAEAQAFKRACAMFGLGRYLYNLPSVWVEYDPNTKQFTDKAKAKLEGIIVQHYRRRLNELDQACQAPQASGEKQQPAKASEDQIEQLNALGAELYGNEWPQVSRHNVERITNTKEQEAKALTVEEVQKLIAGMNRLKAQRREVALSNARDQAATVGK